MAFTHLHVHSHYSMLDGMSKVPDIVNKCIKTGMNAVALTDHGNMYGIKDLLDHCKKLNDKRKEDGLSPFKPIVGCECYCARRGRHSMEKDRALNGEGREYEIDRSGWHLILLAKNKVGYHNMCHIVSESFMDDAYYHKPRIDRELLEKYHEGIICSSACLGGELPQKIMAGDIQGAEETIAWYKNLFGEDYYIEIQRHQTDKPNADQTVYQHQKKVNPILVALAQKHGVKVIATNDAHFVDEENAEAHDRLICINTASFVDDVNRMHYTKQEWLKTPEEMAEVFKDIPEALENTQEIVDKVEIYDIDSGPIMPNFPIPEDFGTEEGYKAKFSYEDLFNEFTRDEHGNVVLSQEKAEEKVAKLGGYEKLYRIKLEADYLAYLTYKGAKERYGETLSEEQSERILFELHIMKTMGFPGYFLIVMDFIRAAREELGVSVGPGRGSAAGSVVAYCLHITDLDPLKYDLLFERFLNPDRISLPDIDTDFDDVGRPKVIEWVTERYGKTHVAHIVTYGKMATKSAIADVGRVQRLPLQKVAELKSFIPDKSFPEGIKDENGVAPTGKAPKVNLGNCFKYIEPLREELKNGEKNVREVLEYARQLEDTNRQVGIHACGIIIGKDDLTKFAPLSSVWDPKLKKRVLVTQYDGHVVESVGLIKMDFLGLITLNIIKECIKNVRKRTGEQVDIDHIPIDDELTYKLFQEGKTVGVFQFESAGMRKYMKELQPTVIGDIIAMNALYRPGPMDYIPQFIRRKKGEEPVTYDIPIMEKYLKDTYGVTVYQEQVMLLSRLLAGFTRGESDKLRKAMGKKIISILEELKGKFLAGGEKNGHDKKTLEKIWADWEKFASYAFNKSHAACYSWVAYQTAYLKAHYPAEFLAANLTVSKDNIKEVSKFMDECKELKINVLPPDVNESDMLFTVNEQGDIRFGLGGIKGVGEGAVEAIVSEREQNGKYKDLFDFLERVNLSACNKKTIENLAKAGAFDCFADYYREQLFTYNSKGELVLDSLIRYGNKYQQDKQLQQNSLFGAFGDMEQSIQHPEMPKVDRWSALQRLNIEKELIGIYLSAHPLDEYAYEMHKLCGVDSAWLNRFDSIRTPSARSATPVSESTQGNSDSEEQGEQTDETAEQSVGKNPDLLLSGADFIQKYKNSTVTFGGIITSAENRMSKAGNPYGSYVVEDYQGNYRFALFQDSYKNFSPLLRENVYVYITGVVQPRGAQHKFFRPQPDDETEFELIITQVEMLNQIQDKLNRPVKLRIALEDIDEELISELSDQCQAHKGGGQVQIQVVDKIHNYTIALSSTSTYVHITPSLYHWIEQHEKIELV